MNNLKKKLIVPLMFLFSIVFSITSYAAASNTERVAGTRTFKQTIEKNVSGPQGDILISYTISGNYTYDKTTGAILSAYNEKLADHALLIDPRGEDPTFSGYVIHLENLVVGPPTVSGTGDHARYPVRFNLKLQWKPGGLDMGTWDYGLINDYAVVYAE